MKKSTSKWLTLAGGILFLFTATLAVLLNVIPKPHKNLDYLVIGAVATFLSMILLWVMMMQGWVKAEDELPKE